MENLSQHAEFTWLTHIEVSAVQVQFMGNIWIEGGRKDDDRQRLQFFRRPDFQQALESILPWHIQVEEENIRKARRPYKRCHKLLSVADSRHCYPARVIRQGVLKQQAVVRIIIGQQDIHTKVKKKSKLL